MKSEIRSINSARKCYESIKGDCIASKTLNLYPYCPYCEKIHKIIINEKYNFVIIVGNKSNLEIIFDKRVSF
ncbi:unnamed protein product [marine sediment metagenome]|uniref:Glutaredoxin domain-containing protein n=1 Tax=marine sediment metagenome TaxID=412755 RepID=X1D6W9_9ZZZZ